MAYLAHIAGPRPNFSQVRQRRELVGALANLREIPIYVVEAIRNDLTVAKAARQDRDSVLQESCCPAAVSFLVILPHSPSFSPELLRGRLCGA